MSPISLILKFLYEFKAILIALLILIIIHYIKKWSTNELENDDSVLEFKQLSPEEQRLYLLTKFNTSINREMPKDQDKYLKNGYNFIYGKEAEKMLSKSISKRQNISEKKKTNVKFNDAIEFSRN